MKPLASDPVRLRGESEGHVVKDIHPSIDTPADHQQAPPVHLVVERLWFETAVDPVGVVLEVDEQQGPHRLDLEVERRDGRSACCVAALVFMVSEQLVAPALIDRFFSWLPAWFLNPAEFDHIVAMPTGPLLIFLGSLLVFAGVVPVVEELYSRGLDFAGLGALTYVR